VVLESLIRVLLQAVPDSRQTINNAFHGDDPEMCRHLLGIVHEVETTADDPL